MSDTSDSSCEQQEFMIVRVWEEICDYLQIRSACFLHGFWQADIHTQLTWKLWDYSSPLRTHFLRSQPNHLGRLPLLPSHSGPWHQVPQVSEQSPSPLSTHSHLLHTKAAIPPSRCSCRHPTVPWNLPGTTAPLAVNTFITSTLWGSNSKIVLLLVLLTEKSAYGRKKWSLSGCPLVLCLTYHDCIGQKCTLLSDQSSKAAKLVKYYQLSYLRSSCCFPRLVLSDINHAIFGL